MLLVPFHIYEKPKANRLGANKVGETEMPLEFRSSLPPSSLSFE